ncbi:receptor-like protein kinase FERONIA [Fagus crenata]
MTNLSMLTPIVSVLCLFVLLYPITAASSTNFSYIPVDDIKLSCGSNGNSKGLDGRVWTGDNNSSFFPREEDNLKSDISEPPKEVLVQGAPYTTTRISYSRFTYVFSVTPGPKFVRLFFYPASYSGFEQSTDFFTVTAGSFTLLKNFSASILLDSLQGTSVLVKEFYANVDGDQKLNLAFIPLTTSYGNCYAFINGIEIVSMPEYLYYSKGLGPSDKEVPLSVGSSHQFYMYYTTALEMVFRLNVGGGLISPMDDTGMFRKWSPDGNYFKLAGVVQHRPSLIPKFSKIPNYTAPGDVYRSARSMSLNQSKNLLSNLTWELPVDSGFFYLVRLHFCEIDININNVSESQFIIYIDYQLAEENADVISWTGGAGIPVYRDYVVWIKNEEVERTPDYSLFISLHPKEGNSTFYDAILNGIEVFKLSNSDGNLGKSSDPKLGVMVNTAIESKKNRTFIAIGISTGLFALLFLMGCIVFQNQRKAKRSGSNYQLSRGTINEIIDPNLKGKIAPKCFEVFMQIAESCTRDEGIQRPTMGDVVEKLKFALEVQENAEAENESMNPGSEYIYPSTLSFFIDTTDDGPWATNEHGRTSDSGIVTGLTYSSFDEDCITSDNSQEVLKNSTKA